MRKLPYWWYFTVAVVLSIWIIDGIKRNEKNRLGQIEYLNNEFHGIIEEIKLSRGVVPTIVVNGTQIPFSFGIDAVGYFEIGDSISKKSTQSVFVVYKMKDRKMIEYKIFKPKLSN